MGIQGRTIVNTQELCDAALNNGFNATAELYDSNPAAAIAFIDATREKTGLGISLAQHFRPRFRVFDGALAGRGICAVDRRRSRRRRSAWVVVLLRSPRRTLCDLEGG